MLLPLGHPALLLLAGILPGVAAQDPRYQVYQLPSISAQAGNSVTLPCNFIYPQDNEPVKDLRVYWRRGGYHGEFIYNHSEGFTHLAYRGRIVLVGDPQGSHTASICISHLRTSDVTWYVCQLRVQKKDGTWEQWRHVSGTKLKVSDRDSVTDAPCTKPTPTTMQIPVQGVPPPGAAAPIRWAVGGAVFLAMIIGLAVSLCRIRTEPGAAPRSLETRQAPGAETLYSAVRIR